MDAFEMILEGLEKRTFLSGSVEAPPLPLIKQPVSAEAIQENAARAATAAEPGAVADLSVVGTWHGQVFSKDALLATLEINIKELAPDGAIQGTLSYQPRKGDAFRVDVTGEFLADKSTIRLSWNQPKVSFGTISATLSPQTQQFNGSINFTDAEGAHTFFVSMDKVQPDVPTADPLPA